jgi:hypothetical protein
LVLYSPTNPSTTSVEIGAKKQPSVSMPLMIYPVYV